MLQLFRNPKINGLNPATIVFTVALLLGIYFLYLVSNILVLLFLAFILMVALNPVAKKFQRWFHVSRTLSIIMAYILLVVILITFLSVLLPPLAVQMIALLKLVNLPGLQDKLNGLNFSLSEISNLLGQVGTSLSTIWFFVGTTFSSIFTFFTLLVLSFFMLLDRPLLALKLSWLVKDKEELARFEKLLDRMEEQLGGWVRGELILMLIIGLCTFVGLTILGIPYALPLAILAGLLEMLPNIGPTLAAVPAVATAFVTKGPVMGGAVLLLTVLIQQLENNLIVPKVMKASANVNPLVSIVSILIGFKLGGVLGALLAVPFYIVLRVVYSTYFYQHRL